MTLGEKLLKLSAEYQSADTSEAWGVGEGARSKAEIAAEYEDTLRQILRP